MAEEHRCQSPPEAHRLCANNCGFFGSPATRNLCSKCYRDFCLKEEQAASAMIAVEKSLLAASSVSSEPLLPPPATRKNPEERILDDPAAAVAAPAAPSPQASASTSQQQQTPSGRCTACRKRVGLTGFRCRCGETYCGTHRYPEQHKCTFDFRSAGKEAIARANPVVKSQKLDKI